MYPSGQARPTASSLNFVPGETIANLVVVQVGSGQKVSVFNFAGSTDIVADVVGYFDDGSGAAPVLFTPVVPARVLDSRNGTGGFSTPWAPGQSRDLVVAGAAGVPANASAVVLNVTVTNPTSPGFVTVWPSGVARPTASNVNFVPGETIPNLVVVQVGSTPMVSLFNFAGSADIVADVVGYYR